MARQIGHESLKIPQHENKVLTNFVGCYATELNLSIADYFFLFLCYFEIVYMFVPYTCPNGYRLVLSVIPFGFH